MRLQEPDERGEEPALTGPDAELVCPDSGQIDEPLRPSRLTERCRKRCKRERKGIIWRRRKQDLEGT